MMKTREEALGCLKGLEQAPFFGGHALAGVTKDIACSDRRYTEFSQSFKPKLKHGCVSCVAPRLFMTAFPKAQLILLMGLIHPKLYLSPVLPGHQAQTQSLSK